MRIHFGPGYRVHFHQTRHIRLCAPDWRRQVDPEARHQTRPEDGAGVEDMTAKKAKAKSAAARDRKSTRLNSSHLVISYAVFCLKKKKKNYCSKLLIV